MDAHLKSCASCRAQLQTIQSLKAAVASLPAPAFPKDAMAALLAEARRAEKTSARAFPFLTRPAFRYSVAGLLAAGCAAVLVFVVARQNNPRTISINVMLAAHEEYALSRPLASADIIYSRLPGQIATADGNPHAL